MRDQEDIETQPLLEPTNQTPIKRSIFSERETERKIDAMIFGFVVLSIIILASVLYCVTSAISKNEGMYYVC